MGLIAGIASRDGRDVSDLLYRMAFKLRHRGNSPFWVSGKGENDWESHICKKAEEIQSLKTPFGVVGRHFVIDKDPGVIPYRDRREKRSLLLDGRIFNVERIKGELKGDYRSDFVSPNVILDWIEEMQGRIFNFSQIYQKIFTLIEGMFAGTLILKNHVFILRDVVGIKPVYLYSGPEYVAFASEKKALWCIGLTQHIEPLPPGRVVRVAEKGFTSHYQACLKHRDIQHKSMEHYRGRLLQLLESTLEKMKPADPFYLLLSGGIDSTLLGALFKKMGVDFGVLVLGTEKSKDVQAAQKAADFLEQPLDIVNFDIAMLEEFLPHLLYHVEDRDEKKLNIAFPLFYGARYLKENGCNTVFTGQGADELFGGYERHEMQFHKDPSKLQSLLWEDVENTYQVNLQRDDAAAMANTMELRLPYLTREFIELVMQIPTSLKIKKATRKHILRQVGKSIGLPESITQQPKRAIQFSSGSYETLKKLAKHHGFTKRFVLNHGFFSPTQTFIDSVAYLLGFPNLDPKISAFVEKTRIDWPESILEHKNLVNTIVLNP